MRNSPLPRMSRRGRVTVGVLVGVFFLFTLLGWGVDAWTDWLWFEEVNFTSVFSGVLVTRLLLFLAVGVVMGAVVGVNLYLAYRLRPLLRPHSAEQATLERYRMALTPRIGVWVVALSILIGFFGGLSGQGHWREWMLFRNAQPFGVKDAQFGADVGYYIFDYPFWRYLLGVGFTAIVLSVIGALAVHYIFGGVRLQGVGDRMTSAARAHLTSLVAIFVLLKAVAYWLDKRALLLAFNEGTGLYGAGYTDVNALLPAKEILSYISIVVAVAIIVFSNAVMRNLVWPGISLALLGIAAVAIGGIYPLAVQTFEVKPSLRDKERQYIERSITATRAAFGLDAAKMTAYPASNTTPPDGLPDDANAKNVRLVDPSLVSEAYTQKQQVRGFYDFGAKLDIDRYKIGEAPTQDFIVGVREINDRQLTAQQRGWQNRHTVFTHGFGMVAAPANESVCGGYPRFVSGFIGGDADQQPGCSSENELIPVPQPRVYYGEESTEYAIVGGSTADRKVEFDRPTSTGQDQYYAYEGKGGVPIGSFGRRLLYAIKNTESNFLLSDAVNTNSRLMYIRDPRSRVEKVAPFLTIDGDPYPAVIDGRIQWILDGYTTAATYPYAQKIDLQEETADELTGQGTFRLAGDQVNYIRNSVKATVDAYDGTVKLYEFDDKDPVLKAWNKAFGGIITPKAETPPTVAAHFRYPADMFKVQRNLLAKFHVTNPEEYFSGQDFWQAPNVPDNPDSNVKQPPFYLNVQLPGQDSQRFQLTSAVTPNGRQNLAALISGSYDAQGKPSLEVLELPDQTAVQGPVQVHQAMTNNNATIRSALNLLSNNNQSRVQYGNLLSLPVADGMLYVEPVYVQSNQVNPVPLLQKVLMSYGDGRYVVLADSLTQGLRDLVAQSKAQPGPPVTGTNTNPPTGTPNPPVAGTPLAAAAAAVETAITEVRDAQKSGDFTRYGQALAKLDTAMADFQKAQAAAGVGPATPAPGASASTAPTPGG